MITDLNSDKLDRFAQEFQELLNKYNYKITNFSLSSGKKIVIVDDNLHPAKIVGFLSPDSENVISKLITRTGN